jgi:hypothetical protein
LSSLLFYSPPQTAEQEGMSAFDIIGEDEINFIYMSAIIPSFFNSQDYFCFFKAVAPERKIGWANLI